MTPARAALHRVSDGYVAPTERTHEGADRLWCRVVARGRIAERHDDGSVVPEYRVRLVIVEHPDLPPAQVYALFGMGQGGFNVYRCLPEDARLALRDGSCYNL